MIVEVGSDLKITNLSDDENIKMLHYLKQELEIENPAFYKLQNRVKFARKIPSRIVLYQKIKNGYLLPFGALKDIYNIFKHSATFKDNTQHQNYNLNFNSKITPYDYQEEAIQKVLQAKNGVLVAPCGSGKTEMALEIIARIGKPTLWITHTQDLLKQSYERAVKCFNVPTKYFGTITQGKVNIGSHITFSTVQTLSKIDLEKIQNEFDVIVVDECHRVGGSPTNVMMFYKCLSNLNARYKIGVTATPNKSGLERSMFCLLGNLIHEIPKSAVEEKLCCVEVKTIESHFNFDINKIINPDGTLNHIKLINYVCENNQRNKLIAFTIKDLKKCIVLSERVEHLNTLQNMVKCETGVVTSQTKNRKEILEDFKNGKIDILFSTYQLMAEGFDCPTLEYLVLATPQKNERIVTQSCGRVARKSDGKQKGYIIDIVDDFFLLSKMRKAREKIYKKNNYKFC